MEQNNKAALQAASPYNAITREQFLFYEVRTTAKLLHEGCNHEEVVEEVKVPAFYEGGHEMT